MFLLGPHPFQVKVEKWEGCALKQAPMIFSIFQGDKHCKHLHCKTRENPVKLGGGRLKTNPDFSRSVVAASILCEFRRPLAVVLAQS